MLSKITKAVFALVATLFALALVLAASLSVWVMTGPKSLTKFLPYIEDSLNPENSPYHVQVGDALVFWDGFREPVDFRLRDVTIRSRDGKTQLLRLSEVSVGLDMPSLLHLQMKPESLILRNPVMRFYRDAGDVLYVGIGEDSNQRVPLPVLLRSLRDEDEKEKNTNPLGDLEFIGVQHAHVILGAPDDAEAYEAEDANMHIGHDGDDVTAAIDITFTSGEKPARVSGHARIKDEDGSVLAKLEMQNFSPQSLTKLYPQQPVFNALDMPLTGWVDLTMEEGGTISLVDYRLRSEAGIFNDPTHFAEPLPIAKASFEGQIRDDLHQFIIKKAAMDFGGPTLSVNGIAQLHEEGWTADAIAVAEKMPVNDLYKYWPKTISPTSYHWVTTHIREGIVPHAEAKLKLTEDDLGKPFPEAALDVNIQAEGVEVNYLDGHPKVEGVKGIVKFNGRGMTITSQQGSMLTGGVLKDAWLQIPDMVDFPAPMHIKLAIEAPAKDVATYVGIPLLGYAEPLGLNPETISGTASGKMQFDFLLHHSDAEDKDPKLTFTIDADLKDAAQPGFMGDMNLSGVNGKLLITEKQLKYDGVMAVSNAPLNVALVHHFKPAGAFATEYRATGVMAVPQLAAFGVPDLPFLMGNVGLDATIQRNPKNSHVVVLADLAQVAADVKAIGLVKPAGKPAMLRFEADATKEAVQVKSFELNGDEIYAKGTAAIAEKMKKLASLHFERLEYGDNNFKLDVEQKQGGYKIRAKGASLDLQPLYAKKPDTPATEELEGDDGNLLPFAVDAEGEFDWVVMGKERELRKVKAVVDCTETRCNSVDIRGVTGQENAFSYQIKPVDGVRQLSFSAQNVGSFLKAMNLYDNMVGGTANLHGTFDDTAPNSPMKGRLAVSEHNIINAPTLAKMASLLSLKGIGDALQGKGITFRELKSDVTYEKGVVRLKNGKTYGPALGITLEDGRIDTNDKEIFISGTVVPSYTLNTVLNNIPVIGEALSGGKGEGVFAATYKVEGHYPDKTEVSVNPLSMLAPGFLRNIFGGAEKAPKKEEKKEESKAEAPKAEVSTPAPVQSAPTAAAVPQVVKDQQAEMADKPVSAPAEAVTPPSQ